MIRIILLLVILFAAFALLRWFSKAPTEQVSKLIKRGALGLLALLCLYFFATGRLNGLVALFGVLMAGLLRFLPVLLRYAPQLHRLWFLFNQSRAQNGRQYQKPHASGPGAMTKEQAYQVLGLKPGASREQILLAHRRLMAKNHPDKGGSDYIAAQLNLAKKILLT